MNRGIALLLAAASVTVAAATAGASATSFSGHGVAFDYPSGWVRLPADGLGRSGMTLWQVAVAPVPPAQGGGRTRTARDLVGLAALRTPLPITSKTLAHYRSFLRWHVTQLAAEAGGRLISGPTRTTLGPFAAYSFLTSGYLADSTAVRSRVVFAFDRHVEYYLDCQHVRRSAAARRIEAGCTQLQHSLRLTQ